MQTYQRELCFPILLQQSLFLDHKFVCLMTQMQQLSETNHNAQSLLTLGCQILQDKN